MSNNDSMFLDNTKKDLIGGITAAVFLSFLLRAAPDGGTLDSHLVAFLTENSQEIDKFVDAVLTVALTGELKDEVAGTLKDLVLGQPGYYDKTTINALLSLYAGETKMKDFCAASESEFHQMCRKILEEKLLDLIESALWCRVEAYERGLMASKPELSKIYLTSLPLIPLPYREELESLEVRVVKAKNHWRESEATQKGLNLTKGADSGLTRLLSQI